MEKPVMTNSAAQINSRIAHLRAALVREKLDALVIPSNDPHSGEYVADHWKAREWASGFTGSAGTVVITADHAGLWTDSRYFLQAESELAENEMQLHKLGEPGTLDHVAWLLAHLQPGGKVAIDGKLLSVSAYMKLGMRLMPASIKLVTAYDLIAECWTDRPALPTNSVFVHELKFSGKSTQDKLVAVRAAMRKVGAENHLLSTLDDIAWLYNLRGSDVECNPVFYAYSLIGLDSAVLFVDLDKVSETIITLLKQDGVTVLSQDALPTLLGSLDGSNLLFAPEATSVALWEQVPEGCEKIEGAAPTTLLKAVKNAIEIENIRQVMAKDGYALLRLYRWLEAEIEGGEVTEDQVAAKLAAFRAEGADYIGESFGAIAGYQGNGAIVHYRPLPGESATLKKEGIFLLDSGGQYLDGTTDITRTVALGTPTAEQKRDYTLVLKGHIALAKARFPAGSSGYQLDTLARMFLWEEGLDYGHGTGHGVGFFLNVHEGPQSIRGNHSGMATTTFLPGMFTSNEPGRYKAG
ncbi:MAG TPA: aminopeptidase P family protein, partial [Bacteroidetes bacterium]|nr:aminopeptidase P family protein [Bacteroidota bacterium]